MKCDLLSRLDFSNCLKLINKNDVIDYENNLIIFSLKTNILNEPYVSHNIT
ncbi:Hypothetical protein CINCED_3A020184 [Cinara cedri]|uniref:Uncharacterized protein n=1 Tax=Cinara cedri TaxID=506608 RepID=A0A5E4N9C7_9HEMI|nr:Hypothetical protein CINCED_3A020184 [Cinara cedri]